jgi:hypothetical protein
MWIANVLVQVNFADERIKISEMSVTSPKSLESFFFIHVTSLSVASLKRETYFWGQQQWERNFNFKQLAACDNFKVLYFNSQENGFYVLVTRTKNKELSYSVAKTEK